MTIAKVRGEILTLAVIAVAVLIALSAEAYPRTGWTVRIAAALVVAALIALAIAVALIRDSRRSRDSD